MCEDKIKYHTRSNIRQVPIFRMIKSENIFLTKLNMSFSSEGCNKK
jgi:hypothetical protein